MDQEGHLLLIKVEDHQLPIQEGEDHLLLIKDEGSQWLHKVQDFLLAYLILRISKAYSIMKAAKISFKTWTKINKLMP